MRLALSAVIRMTGVAPSEWLFKLAIILGNLLTVARRQRDNTPSRNAAPTGDDLLGLFF